MYYCSVARHAVCRCLLFFDRITAIHQQFLLYVLFQFNWKVTSFNSTDRFILHSISFRLQQYSDVDVLDTSFPECNLTTKRYSSVRCS
jgi:hypothetical protein